MFPFATTLSFKLALDPTEIGVPVVIDETRELFALITPVTVLPLLENNSTVTIKTSPKTYPSCCLNKGKSTY